VKEHLVEAGIETRLA
ncbi:hypothetical protein CBR_g89209, partial [Chara braunii]